jgi:hypothetical protein
MEKNSTTGAGNLREEGEIQVDENIEEQQGPDEIYDESGNKIIVKKALDAKQIKAAIKDIEKKVKENKKKNTLSDEDAWELSDRLEELKSQLEAKK